MRKPLPQEDLDFVIAHTADVWTTFDQARIFITGGTGFIGSWLLEVVQRANEIHGCRIGTVVLSRDPDGARAHFPHLFNKGEVTLVQGNLLDFEARTGTIDACIHAATDVSVQAKAGDALRVFDSGVLGTRRVLDFALTNGATHFLLTSSGAVYGTQPSSLVGTPETFGGAPDSLDVSNAYAQGKRAAEWLVSAYGQAHGLHVTIARIFALVGPGIPLDGSFAAGNFIRDALAGRQISINGDGRPRRSYLYVADACVWLLRIMMAGHRGDAYNVGSEHDISIAELARSVEHLCETDTPSVPRAPIGDGPAPRYVPNTTKAREALGVDEYTPLEVALSKTINWNRMAVKA